MKAIILAAGKGTRLAHLTHGRPKPMIPIGGVPLLEHHLRWLHSHSITEVTINLHHAPEYITSYVEDGRRFGVSVLYSHETTLLGTAGAAKRMQGFLDEPFVVIYGDVYTNLRLDRIIRFHQAQVKKHASDQVMTLALYEVPNPTECGLVEVNRDGRILRFVEKPAPDQVFTRLANGGIMVCEPGILDAVPPETVFDFGHDLFPKLLQANAPLFGLALAEDEYLIDVGTPAGYIRAESVAAGKTPSLTPVLS